MHRFIRGVLFWQFHPREEKISSPTYKDAGVDIDAGNATVDAIKPLAQSTARPGADAALGGFGAAFDLAAAGYQDPILVAATDGVGTKLKIAIETGRHDTVGIDLVAMCVNDLIVQGAEPLFFLDYFGTGKLSPDHAAEVVSGIAEGCRQAGCALTGGETAELPGLYAGKDYDLAGFAVGAVERDALLTGVDIAPGDIILGLASSGLHSNGYSLVRHVIGQKGLDYGDAPPFDTDADTLGEALLQPTRIYVRACLDAVRSGAVHALAHITGGGLIENLPRVLPTSVDAAIDAKSWDCPDIFGWLAREGGIEESEMARTFNCGIGMAVIAPAARADDAIAMLEAAGETVWKIGKIEASTGERPAVRLHNLDALGGR